MNRENIKKLLEMLKTKRIRMGATDVMCSCPFAEWTHQDKKDRHPSFGIKIEDNGASKYGCFACGVKGVGMANMLAKLNKYRKIDEEIFEFARDNEINKYEIINKFKQGHNVSDTLAKIIIVSGSENKPQVLSQDICDRMLEVMRKSFSHIQENSDLYDYLVERINGGINDIKDIYEIMYDSPNTAITIPIFDRKRRLVGIQGRKLRSENWKYFFYLFDTKNDQFVIKYREEEYENMIKINKSDYIYPEWLVDSERDIVIVEGVFDAIKLRSYGLNAVSTFGTKVSHNQIDKIIRYVGLDKYIYILFDNDESGKKSANELYVKIRKQYNYKYCDILDINIKDKKDPDELSKEEIFEIIENKKCQASR
jgi:5S rRNA maturation endonuclease (ribonuclease M5)